MLAGFRDRLRVVASLVPETGREAYVDRVRLSAYDLFSSCVYDSGEDEDALLPDVRDPDAPHAPIRAAALATPDDEPQVFHHRAIHEGVREAAEIRAREIKEDFPWADQALETLRDMVVPCSASDVLGAWEYANLEELLEKNPEARRRARSGGDLAGVIEDLRELGVTERLPDNRINVPDVYRLRFGIKRRGGVAARRA